MLLRLMVICEGLTLSTAGLRNIDICIYDIAMLADRICGGPTTEMPMIWEEVRINLCIGKCVALLLLRRKTQKHICARSIRIGLSSYVT